MADKLRSNPISIRTCVLFHFTEKLPVFDAYQNICDVLGEETMTFQEFQFWFKRFSERNFDLTYDISKEPKKPTFNSLTAKIVRKVISNLELKDITNLGLVSDPLRDITDSIPIIHREGTITITNRGITLKIDGKNIVNQVVERVRFSPYGDVIEDYFNSYEGDDEDVHFPRMKEEEKNTFGLPNMIEAKEQALKFLMHPRLKFHKGLKLHLKCCPDEENATEYDHNIKDILILFLKKIAHHVTTVVPISHPFTLRDLIQCLIPGTLKLIQFERGYTEFWEERPELINDTDQWKQAEKVVIKNIRSVPSQDFVDSPRFAVQGQNGSLEEFLKLKNAILTFPNFQHCRIISDDSRLQNFPRWENQLGEFTCLENQGKWARCYFIENAEKTRKIVVKIEYCDTGFDFEKDWRDYNDLPQRHYRRYDDEEGNQEDEDDGIDWVAVEAERKRRHQLFLSSHQRSTNTFGPEKKFLVEIERIE